MKPTEPEHVVVYVEDDPVNLRLMEWILQTKGGYRFFGASDGLAGLALIEKHHPDLALIDLDLPLISGFELIFRIRKNPALEQMPMVAVSASVMGKEKQRCLEAGCQAFIEKPFDIHRLRSIVEECLRLREKGSAG